MARDINLTSQKWLNLVFEGRNKEYGAYVLREESSDRHVKSLLIVTIVGLAFIFLPKIISSVIPKAAEVTQQEEVTMVDLTQDIPEENQIKEIENVPPPPLLKETIAFTPPVIKKDDEVRDDQLMTTQQELTDNKADISVATIAGTKDGVDIADLQEHKVVVQEEKKPEIFHHVEVMPSFPGGEKELMKFLHDNLIYPTIAQEQGVQGRVTLRFVVGPDGAVRDVEIQRSLDPSCDKEAIRVVKKMPKWIPGKQNGNPVNVYYTLPVFFKLQ